MQGKGDPLVCGSYIAIKLLEQPMKVLEVSIDNWIWKRNLIEFHGRW